MTLNDLLRQGRSITEQLSSGDISLTDGEGKEINVQLALHQPKDELACAMVFVRRRLDDMTQEELEDLNTITYHNIGIQDNRLCGYICGGELREVLNWLDEHNFEY